MKRKIITVVGAVVTLIGITPGASALETQSVRKGVVRIICLGQQEGGTGTGFVINSSGNIVTNYHVIRPIMSGGGVLKIITDDLAEQLKPQVEAKFGGRLKDSGGLVDDQLQLEIIKFLLDKLPDAKVRYPDEAHDLAVLESSAVGLTPLNLTPSEKVNEGQPVYALGYPGKGDLVGVTAFLTLKVYNGVVASKESKSSNGEKIYQTTAPFSGGNSGGPLVDECGSVIGVTSFHIGDQVGGMDVGESVRYAIQIDELLPLLRSQDVTFNAGTGCAPAGGSSSLTTFGVFLAVLLGLAAFVMAASKRGRTVVKGAVGNTVQMFKSSKTVHTAPARQPIAILKGLEGEYHGRGIPFDGGPLVMGRDPQSCHVVFIQAVRDISKRHCTLRCEAGAGRVLLEDLGSTNGTFVISGGKAERIPPGQPRTLAINDRFCLGGLENIFELQFIAAQQPAPAEVYGRPQPVMTVAGKQAVVKGLQGEYAGRAIPVGPDKILIGRDPSQCHLVFPACISVVSKRHCSLSYNAATYAFLLEDLGSQNGTFLLSSKGKERLQPHQPRTLVAGDRFFVGDQGILFEVGLE